MLEKFLNYKSKWSVLCKVYVAMKMKVCIVDALHNISYTNKSTKWKKKWTEKTAKYSVEKDRKVLDLWFNRYKTIILDNLPYLS